MTMFRWIFGGGSDELVAAARIKHASIDATFSDTTEIVAAVSGRRIVVLSYVISCGAASSFQWLDAAAALSPVTTLGDNRPFSASDRWGLLRTTAGQALQMAAGAGTSNNITGHLTYVEASA